MITRYDVIIIGAGPGGLRCAEELKNSRLSVLLIEKNKAIGPKVCAGGLTGLVLPQDIPHDNIMKFPEEYFYVGTKKYAVRWKTPTITISRKDLGQFQLAKIRRAKNIRIIKGAYAKEITNDKVITNKGTFYFKFLVGADGSFSIVRKHLGLGSKILWAVNCELPLEFKQFRNFSWHFNPQELRNYYIWFFPHINYTSIGVGFDPKYLDFKKARAILKDFLAKRGCPVKDDVFRCGALNYDYQGCAFGNIFLVGDAAGLASKTTGEGISFALVSGKEAGKRIINPDYKMAELKRLLGLKKRQEMLSKLANIFFYFKPSASMMDRAFKIGIRALKKSWFRDYFFGHK